MIGFGILLPMIALNYEILRSLRSLRMTENRLRHMISAKCRSTLLK